VRRRTLLYLLFLRTLLALIPVAVIVGFFLVDRYEGLLPQNWWFVVLTVCTAVLFVLWADRVARRWKAEEARPGQSTTHYASSPRTKLRHRRRRRHHG
jgi:undecaprenyl pyrophosphate phosphatase UppP